MTTTTHPTMNSSRRRSAIPARTHPRDRLSYLWLAIAIVLIGVAFARRRTAGEAGAAAPITASPSSGEPLEASLTSPSPSLPEEPLLT